ncbi:MAG: hypothetical protein SPE18_06490 [Candidatus Limivicinus sp.]|nr:hypothetical protein [Candidatus Limivicinus sp.]
MNDMPVACQSRSVTEPQRDQGPLLALPQSHLRACFATARKRRGYGNCSSPSSAAGSGEAQFSQSNNPPQKSLKLQAFWAKQRFEGFKTLGG